MTTCVAVNYINYASIATNNDSKASKHTARTGTGTGTGTRTRTRTTKH